MHRRLLDRRLAEPGPFVRSGGGHRKLRIHTVGVLGWSIQWLDPGRHPAQDHQVARIRDCESGS